jgi:hypothetical protein
VFVPIRGRFHVNITAAIVIRRRPGGGPGTEDAPLSIGLREDRVQGSDLSAGRSPHWVKVTNPKAPAVTREAEEDWGRWSHR